MAASNPNARDARQVNRVRFLLGDTSCGRKCEWVKTALGPTIPSAVCRCHQIHTDHDGIIYGLFTRHLMCSSRSINELNAYRIELDENEKSF